MGLLGRISHGSTGAGDVERRVDPGGRRTADRLRGLLNASTLAEAPSMEALLARAGAAARTLLGASQASVHLYDADRGELWAPARSGRRRLSVGNGVRAEALRTGHAVSGPAANGSLLCAPLRDGGRVIGLLEVGNPDGAAFDMASLQAASVVAEHAASAVQRYRLNEAAAQGEALRREVQQAQQVQAAVRTARAEVAGLEAFASSSPASIACADCVDYWPLADGRLALFLGDASGHGVAGAMVIAQVRALLRALADVRADPAWLLQRVNSRLNQDLEPSRFVTAFLGCLAPDGRLDCCSAGQAPIYVRTTGKSDYTPMEAHAPPLGINPDLRPDAAPPVYLAPGGRVVVVSDGILEAANGSAQRLGAQRVKTVLDNTADLPPERAVDLLRDVLTTWQGSDDPADDQSVLVAGRR